MKLMRIFILYKIISLYLNFIKINELNININNTPNIINRL